MTAPRSLLVLALLPSLAAAQVAPARVITLDEAVQSARAHQPQLQQAQASARAATARAEQARSGLLPQLGAAGSVERAGSDARVTVPIAGGGTRTVSAGTSTTWSGTLSADQVLFSAGTYFGWRSAQSSAESFRSTADTTLLDVVSGVRAAYFTARAGRDLARVAREAVENNQAHLRQVEAFVEIGTQPPIALAQTRSDLATAQLALLRAENAYATAKADLAQAMGLETWDDFEVGDDTLPPVPGEEGAIAPLLAEAMAARPELAALSAQERANEQSRSAARSGYIPTLNARATYGASGPQINDTAANWSAGLNLSWSLFDGGLTSARVREADANLDALRAQETGLRTSIRVALEQAYLGVKAARSSVQAASEAEAAAREQLRLAEGRFQAGAGGIIELGDAQVNLNTTAAQRVQAEYNLAAARAALLRALGRE